MAFAWNLLLVSAEAAQVERGAWMVEGAVEPCALGEVEGPLVLETVSVWTEALAQVAGPEAPRACSQWKRHPAQSQRPRTMVGCWQICCALFQGG